MLTKKHTAWKKNRKFGDKMGGRLRTKLEDNVFFRCHSLLPPSPDEVTPIYIVDNPSRDFYFPVSVEEVESALLKLPKEHTEHLTHIWLKKIKKADYLTGDTFQACFINGSKIALVVLYPFPKDNMMRLGKTKPLDKILNSYKKYTTQFGEDETGWFLVWTKENVKKYYLEHLLLHVIGRSLDSFYKRYYSKTALQKRENFANNYASVWMHNLTGTNTIDTTVE